MYCPEGSPPPGSWDPSGVCSVPQCPVTCSTSAQVCLRVTLRPCRWRGFGRIRVPGAVRRRDSFLGTNTREAQYRVFVPRTRLA